jgi:hypothetical protein
MRTRRLLCGLVVLTLICATPSIAHAQDKDKKEAELKWARSIVKDYLEMLTTNPDQAPTLLTADLREKKIDLTTFDYHLDLTSLKFTSEEISPDLDEVVFRGTMKQEKGKQTFKVLFRVVKEKSSGKWRICQCTTTGVEQ